MSTVAVVMTTYNGEKYVEEQIKSILSSSYQDFALFIFDDGSKDSTISILERYKEDYPEKINIARNSMNYGVTMNFIQALTKMTADYIMFSDQDDVWLPNKIGVTLKRMKHMEAQFSKEKPIAVFTDARVVDQNLSTMHPSFFGSGHLDPRKTDLAHLLMENKLIGCTVMVNAALRRKLQENRLPQHARYHDWWVALIAASFGKIGYVEEGTLLYRQHGNNMVGDSGFSSYLKNRLSNLQKQKKALEALYRQAEDFLSIYCSQLSEDNREILRRFFALEELGFTKKRIEAVRNGFLKSGLVRNLGLLLIL